MLVHLSAESVISAAQDLRPEGTNIEKPRPLARYLLWLLLTTPGAVLLWRYSNGATFYGEVIHLSGQWAVWLLIMTMAVSPIRLLFTNAPWTVPLFFCRRYLGVASFAYAALHTGVYLVQKKSGERILAESLEPGLLTGWFALAIFLPLALSSNDWSVRLLRRWWKRLHRAIYGAAALVFMHWYLTAFDPTEGLYYLALLTTLEVLRVTLTLMRRAQAS
ncbi:MAG: ferric reductase-like transmembrane domain-containing protein [Pseudomonadota bacterium]